MLQRYEVFPKSPLSLAKYFFKTNAADIRSGDVSGIFAHVFLEVPRSVAHARRGGQGGQEGGERGYYHLHHQLNQSFLRHLSLSFLFFDYELHELYEFFKDTSPA